MILVKLRWSEENGWIRWWIDTGRRRYSNGLHLLLVVLLGFRESTGLGDTRLSANWLKAAANGQACEPWHRLVDALIQENPRNLIQAAEGILATGHSSGADALTGYVAGLTLLAGLGSS